MHSIGELHILELRTLSLDQQEYMGHPHHGCPQSRKHFGSPSGDFRQVQALAAYD